MSFGFSVGDFITVGQLAWTVYRACKGAAGGFQEVSREVLTLHTVLKELEDEASNERSLLNRRGSRRRDELMMILDHANIALKDLDDIVNRYQKLGRNKRQLWDTVRFAAEDLDTIRGQINFHTSAIGLFQNSLSAGSLARIEVALDELVREVREGRRPPTSVSAHETDDPSVWQQLEKELADEGISRQEVLLHKPEIKLYLKALLGDLPARPPSISDIPTGFYADDDDDENWDSISERMAIGNDFQIAGEPLEKRVQIQSEVVIEEPAYRKAFLPSQQTPLTADTGVHRRTEIPHHSPTLPTKMPSITQEETLDSGIEPDVGLSQSSSLPTNLSQRNEGPPETPDNQQISSAQFLKDLSSVPAAHSLSSNGILPKSSNIHAPMDAQPQTFIGDVAKDEDDTLVDAPHRNSFDFGKFNFDHNTGNLNRMPDFKVDKTSIHRSSPASVLIVDLNHSEASRIAQAYLTYLCETYSAVKHCIGKVQSAGHYLYETSATSYYPRIERVLSEVFSDKGMEAPPWARRKFKVEHVRKYDYILVLEDPLHYGFFEKEMESARSNPSGGLSTDGKLAKLLRFDNPNILDKPEYCEKPVWLPKGIFEKRAKKGLEDVYQVVKFYCLLFLERELGLKETPFGFGKDVDRGALLQEEDSEPRGSTKATRNLPLQGTQGEALVSPNLAASDANHRSLPPRAQAQIAVRGIESGKSLPVSIDFQRLDGSELNRLRPSKSSALRPSRSRGSRPNSLVGTFVDKPWDIHQSRSTNLGLDALVESNEKQASSLLVDRDSSPPHQPSQPAEILTVVPNQPSPQKAEGPIPNADAESLPEPVQDIEHSDLWHQESDLLSQESNSLLIPVVEQLRSSGSQLPSQRPSSANPLLRRPVAQSQANLAGLFETESRLPHSKSFTASDPAATLSGPFDPLDFSPRRLSLGLHIKPNRSMADLLTSNPRPSPSLEDLLKLYNLAPDRLTDGDRMKVEGWTASI